jgi:nitrile hydratase
MTTATYVTYADLGGQRGFGRVVEPGYDGTEPVFHAPWEATALALTVAMGASGEWNIDISRSAREQLPGYVALSYYEKWLGGLLQLLLERALVGEDELAAGHALRTARPVKRVLRAADVTPVLAKGSSAERKRDGAPRFAVGDRVRTLDRVANHHTRLPGYARGKVGRVAALHGAHVFADSNAQGQGEAPQWLYSIEFDAATLWPDATGPHVVSIDAWEPYMENCVEHSVQERVEPRVEPE